MPEPTPEKLQIRIHPQAECVSPAPGVAAASVPTLIYLPGLHGDWTLISSFRQALAGRARFVEITYPRSLTWSLDDYARAIESELKRSGIEAGWLLAESYGSQVGWQLVGRGRLQVAGLILAGGFVRHPATWGVRLASALLRKVSPPLMMRLLHVYSKVFQVRFRRAPEVIADMGAFLARRTDLDRRAAKHRLDLIAANDPCSVARNCASPVYSLTGFFDAIVPWVPVRRWLRRNCPALRDQRIIWRADHTVLATAPQAAADQVAAWIKD
jgi:pimeloyl-ACP methyl ester carboxylesterase